MTRMVSAIKNSILKQNSLFIATIFASAFVVELVYDGAVESAWKWHNRGVRGFVNLICLEIVEGH